MTAEHPPPDDVRRLKRLARDRWGDAWTVRRTIYADGGETTVAYHDDFHDASEYVRRTVLSLVDGEVREHTVSFVPDGDGEPL